MNSQNPAARVSKSLVSALQPMTRPRVKSTNDILACLNG